MPLFFTTQIYCPHPSLSKSWMQCSPSQDAIACGASECFEVGIPKQPDDMCHVMSGVEAIFLGSGGTTCIPKSYVFYVVSRFNPTMRHQMTHFWRDQTMQIYDKLAGISLVVCALFGLVLFFLRAFVLLHEVAHL